MKALKRVEELMETDEGGQSDVEESMDVDISSKIKHLKKGNKSISKQSLSPILEQYKRSLTKPTLNDRMHRYGYDYSAEFSRVRKSSHDIIDTLF